MIQIAGYPGPPYPVRSARFSYPGSGSAGWPDEENWYPSEGDGFHLPPAPEDYAWDAGDEYEPDPEEDPPAIRRHPLLDVLSLRRGFRGADAAGSRTVASSARRLGAILLAAASVIGVAVHLPSILAAGSRSFTGVVSSSGIASLDFAASGRVGTVRVHLGQAVRQGELLATETGAATTAAVRGPTGRRSRQTRPTWPRCKPTDPRPPASPRPRPSSPPRTGAGGPRTR